MDLGTAIKIVGSNNKDIASISGNTYKAEGVIINLHGEKKIILTEDLQEYQADSDAVEIIDGSQNTTGVNIDAESKGISLIGGTGKDTLISGEQEFELTGGKGNDVFIFNGKSNGKIMDYSQKGKDGRDKIVIDSLLSFKGYEIDGNNVALSYNDGENTHTLTIEGGAGKEITFGTKNSTVNIYREEGIFDSNGKAISLSAYSEKFEATKTYSKIETIDGSAANEVEIIGNKRANYIKAGSADSTLNGDKGNDTLVGGEGNDIYVYDFKSGNKLIIGYSDGDTISLTGGAIISEVKTINKNTDLELKIDSNKITISGGAGNSFTFNDGEEKTFTANGLLVSADGKTASLTSSFTGKAEDLTTDYVNVSAVLLKKGTSLTAGNDTDNSLIGGKGNDTLNAGTGGSILWGGKGNDILYGEVGEDTFIFWAGDGTDTIFNYSEGDMLQILDKKGSKNSTYSKAVFSGDTLTLSIKGGGKIVLSGVSDGDGININGETHNIIGRKLI